MLDSQQDQEGQALTGGVGRRLLLSFSTLDGPHICQGLPGLHKLLWEAQMTGSRGRLPLMHRDVAPLPRCAEWAPGRPAAGLPAAVQTSHGPGGPAGHTQGSFSDRDLECPGGGPRKSQTDCAAPSRGPAFLGTLGTVGQRPGCGREAEHLFRGHLRGNIPLPPPPGLLVPRAGSLTLPQWNRARRRVPLMSVTGAVAGTPW